MGAKRKKGSKPKPAPKKKRPTPKPKPKPRKKPRAPKRSPFAYLALAWRRLTSLPAPPPKYVVKPKPPPPSPPTFIPFREGILDLAMRRAERLREIPGKPDLRNIRFDERGFVVADDEKGQTYRAYTVTNPRTGERRLFWARENLLEGFETPEDFLDAYKRRDEDNEEVFGSETYQAKFDFSEEAEET